MNVEGNAAAHEELRALGVPLVPAVAVGGRAVHGWNPAGYAALLGVPYRPPSKLDPRELGDRLDRILAGAQALVAGAPEALLDWTPPERDRTVRDLAYHVFRLSAAFVDAMDAGELPEAWLQERAPGAARSAGAIATYGEEVRARLARWFATGAAAVGRDRVIHAYYGEQTAHDLLERTTWHAAQHLRQLHVLAERRGMRPPAPLPLEAFAGLPLPESLW